VESERRGKETVQFLAMGGAGDVLGVSGGFDCGSGYTTGDPWSVGLVSQLQSALART
jgi:hypothetical protein